MNVGNVVRVGGMYDKNDTPLLAIVEKIVGLNQVVLRYCYADVPSVHNNGSEDMRTRDIKKLILVRK
jgi:hypothetical protein